MLQVWVCNSTMQGWLTWNDCTEDKIFHTVFMFIWNIDVHAGLAKLVVSVAVDMEIKAEMKPDFQHFSFTI